LAEVISELLSRSFKQRCLLEASLHTFSYNLGPAACEIAREIKINKIVRNKDKGVEKFIFFNKNDFYY
jgi:hypothetical protein